MKSSVRSEFVIYKCGNLQQDESVEVSMIGVSNMNDTDLQRLVEKISLIYFKKPFLHRSYFNRRLRTTGGRYLLQTHDIEINKLYFDQFGEEELIGIIKHELCHYHLHIEGKGYRHRDRDFKELMNKVGAPRFCSVLPGVNNKQRTRILTYVCTNCHTVFKRKRRVNLERYVCGKCKGKLKEVTKASKSAT